MENAELAGLLWVKVGAILLVAFSVLYPVGMIVIGGYLRERREKKKIKWPKN